jgi:hypothetical protein
VSVPVNVARVNVPSVNVSVAAWLPQPQKWVALPVTAQS